MSSLSSLVVERGAATIRQVEEALTRQVIYGGDLAMNLLEILGPEGEARLAEALAAYHRLPLAPLGELPQAANDAQAHVPPEMAVRLGVCTLDARDGVLSIAVSEALAADVEQGLRAAANVARIETKIALSVRVRQALARDYGAPLDRQTMRLLARLRGAPDPFPSSLPPSYRRGSQPPSAPVLPTVPSVPPSANAWEARQARAAAPTMTMGQVAVLHTGTGPAMTTPLGTASSGATETLTMPKDASVTHTARSLAGWARGAGGGEARRRRGPLPRAEAKTELEASTTAQEALQIFFDFARQYFGFSALFIVRGETATMLDVAGASFARNAMPTEGFSLPPGGCLALARERGAPLITQLAPEADAPLTEQLGRPIGTRALVAPLMARSRCVGLLYADDGPAGVELDHAGEVLSVAALTGSALERVALRRKRGAAAAEPQAVVAEPPAAKPSGEVPPDARAVSALARALGLSKASMSGGAESASTRELPYASEPSRTLASHDANPPDAASAGVVADTVGTPPNPSLHDATTVEVLAASDDDGDEDAPTIVVGSASDSDIAQLGLDDTPLSDRVGPPSDGAAYQAPRRLRSPREEPSLPAVIVDDATTEMHAALVDRLMSSEGEAEALDEIGRTHASIAAMLVGRLPGPMSATRDDIVSGRAGPRDVGPVFRALVTMGRAALPFVTAQSGVSSPDMRLYITFLLGDFAHEEAAVALAPRVFDVDVDVRRVARASVRRLGPAGRVARPVMRALEGTLLDASASDERRVAAAEALADLRHGPSVGALLDAFEWADPPPSPRLQASFHTALVTLTGRDLGRTPSAWVAWWRENGRRPRTEWLLDSLEHEPDGPVRDAAAAELSRQFSVPGLSRYTELGEGVRIALRKRAWEAYQAAALLVNSEET